PNNQFYFANCKKPFLSIQSITHTIESEALVQFLQCMNNDAQITFYEDILSLPPATSMLLRKGSEPVLQRYWEPNTFKNSPLILA
ncbi:hypothetical protein ABTL39_19550, partial [Acinetobacter baumannii]